MRKALIGAVGIALVIFGLTVLFINWSTTTAREQAETIYRSIRDELAREVAGTYERLDALAKDSGAIEGGPDTCATPLKAMLDRYSDRNDVFLRIRADGMLDCTPGGPASVDLSERLYFRKAIESRGHVVGEFLVGKVSNEPVLAVARPVSDGAGTISHVLVAGIKTDWLQDVIQALKPDSDLIVEIQDSSGTLMSYFLQGDQPNRVERHRTELVRLPLLPDRSDAELVIFERS